MASINKAIIVGNLGKDPEVRFTPSGQPVANFNVATNDVWTDKAGQRQERTEWHRIVVWGKQAETCGQYLKKGRTVLIEGRIQTREWTDKEGKKNYTTEIVANQVHFLDSRPQGAARPPGDELGPSPQGFEPLEPPPSSGGANGGPGDDEIPF